MYLLFQVISAVRLIWITCRRVVYIPPSDVFPPEGRWAAMTYEVQDNLGLGGQCLSKYQVGVEVGTLEFGWIWRRIPWDFILCHLKKHNKLPEVSHMVCVCVFAAWVARTVQRETHLSQDTFPWAATELHANHMCSVLAKGIHCVR